MYPAPLGCFAVDAHASPSSVPTGGAEHAQIDSWRNSLSLSLVATAAAIPLPLLLCLLLGACAGAVRAQACVLGSWDPPFDHEHGVPPTSTSALYLGSPPWLLGTAQKFNAIHMCLIPKGPHRGKLLVLDHDHIFQGPPALSATCQRWAIVDPDPNAQPRFWNYFLPVSPVSTGQYEWLFCGGHAWTQEGELFFAGGERLVPPQPHDHEGIDKTFIFDPMKPHNLPYSASILGEWEVGPTMAERRWYPTVMLTHRMVRTSTEVVIVAGGSVQVDGIAANNPTWNNYEAFLIPGHAIVLPPAPDVDPQNPLNRIFPGPQLLGPLVDSFYEYPRLHLLTTGSAFLSGYFAPSASVDHDAAPGVWNRSVGQPHPTSPVQRVYGSSFHHPNVNGQQNLIVRLGGFDTPTGLFCDSMEICQAAAPGNWSPMPSMNRPRDQCNAVVLPDASWIVFGGRTPNTSTIPVPPPDEVLEPERFDGSWTDLAPAASARSYHATAVLLPDGRVFVAGGNSRRFDYEIFTPPYLCPTLAAGRPTGVTVNVALDPTDLAFHVGYNAPILVTCNALAPGVSLGKIVLMAPGSDTHHSDMSQRFVELAPVVDGDNSDPPPPNQLLVRTPLNSKHAPRGYWMLFAMNSNGVPSVARWVKLQ